MIDPLWLNGKHIIVTGASSGIGRETCIRASELGAKVSLIGRNQEKMEETKKQMKEGEHKIWVCDLQEIENIDQCIKQITEVNGAVDGLVHCAGIGINRPLKMMKPDFVQKNIIIHYSAFVELIRACSARNRANEYASFIGISSVAAIRGDRTQGAYSAAKAAMNAVIHPLAKELTPKKIRINTVAFGMVETDMYKEFLEGGGNNEELLRKQYLGIIPKEYAASVICFILSDMSRYMTGTTLLYDAGVLS